MIYFPEAVSGVYKIKSGLHSSVVVALYVADIICFVKTVPVSKESDIFTFAFQVVSVALNIVEIFPEAVMLKKSLYIAALTVADDVEGVFFPKLYESPFKVWIENSAVYTEVFVFMIAALIIIRFSSRKRFKRGISNSAVS